MPARSATYAPAARLADVRALLERRTGATLDEIAARAECSTRTAARYLRALSSSGVPLVTRIVDGRKLWRVADHARRAAVLMTTQQMVALALGRRVLDFLSGTGFDDDLDDVFAQLRKHLSRDDSALHARLDEKIHDIQEGRCDYSDRIDDVDAVVTALIREERLDVEYTSKRRRTREVFVLSPYTLVIYRKALYVLGLREGEKEPETFALDGFHAIERRKGDVFAYPAGFSPKAFFGDAPGIIRGPRAEVRIVLDATVTAYAQRRTWHRSAAWTRREDGSVELRMTVDGTTELVNAVLGYGAHAEVKEPRELREEVARIAQEMMAVYRRE